MNVKRSIKPANGRDERAAAFNHPGDFLENPKARKRVALRAFIYDFRFWCVSIEPTDAAYFWPSYQSSTPEASRFSSDTQLAPSVAIV